MNIINISKVNLAQKQATTESLLFSGFEMQVKRSHKLINI